MILKKKKKKKEKKKRFFNDNWHPIRSEWVEGIQSNAHKYLTLYLPIVLLKILNCI